MSDEKNHSDFNKRQSEIYERFRMSQKGLGSGPVLSGTIARQGGFLVAFRHADKITEPTTEFSQDIRNVLDEPGSTVHSLVYHKSVLHTTLSDYHLGEALVDPENPEDRRILDALALAVKRGLGNTGIHAVLKRKIDFDKPLVNANSAIVPGYANGAVLDIIGAVRDASKDTLGGEGLKGGWGAHMTAARFHGNSTREQAGNIAMLAEETEPIGTSAPTAIDVGYLQVNPDGFNYTTHERFPLSK